ncbi:MAG: UDP-N-acetylmuramate--alanine ligase [Parcubacteria group bacterium Athens1014_10]|nr:MAG: UDP-N-acetylmuramate--alanine ligase [Parcubacteria group bacterium Athens1014_10]TSD06062.1 MAG: UDP-N-acetylmuramate--alanine ligase [Parcubacteria group bacterium Athens0714_12]
MRQKIKKIHFIGIGGIGVSAIAKMMDRQGKKITGSDAGNSEIIQDLKKGGIKIFLGHQEKNLADDIDLVVYSSAIPRNNPERKKAKKLKIKQLSYVEILAEISKEKFTLAVSGTHGKSTTTALLGLFLEKAGFNPLVIVGSKLKAFKDGNLQFGKGKFFVIEACEYQENMLKLQPKAIILTNLEKDHLDYYKNLKHLVKSFQKYINKLPKDGLLILNSDDKNLKKLKLPDCKIIKFGIENKADLKIVNRIVKEEKQIFNLIYKNKNLSRFELKVPGLFNLYNFLGACACALEFGVKPEAIKKSLSDFNGIWRRFEKVGEKNGAIFISDYAHHPTAVKKTIQAAKEFYPKRRIVAVFQPHLASRTKDLFKEFIEAFDLADIIILSEIYRPAGREENLKISSKDLIMKIKKRGKKILYAADLKEIKKLISENIKKNDLVLIMGAGDIYKLKIKN